MLYNLENLSWQEFETLTKFYLKEKIGEGLWVFDGSQDMGRDAAFTGTANEFPSKTAPYNGNWIFQTKHRTTRGKTQKQAEKELLDTLQKELNKIFIKHQFACNNYVYIINLNASNQFRQNAQDLFTQFCLDRNLNNINFNVIEYKDLEVFISNNKPARYSFPSLLTFTDLEKIYLRKEEIKNKGYIKFALDKINVFTSTTHYIEALKRINEFDILMLVGDPKSGKTSIVDAIAIYFLQEGSYKPYFIKNTDEFFSYNAYLPEGERALFICDDIFGVHELDRSKFKDWADYFQSVLGLVQPNRKFLFTTRKYIYEEFANKSDLRNFFPKTDDPNRYVVKLGDLAKNEREQIIEKHLSSSNLSTDAISLVASRKEDILQSKDFSPEVVRSLMALLANIEIYKANEFISNHLSHPNQYLYDFFNNINLQKRMLLLSVAVSATPEIGSIEETYLNVLEDGNEKPQNIFMSFIDEIDGSIIKKREYFNTSEIEYYHPSMFEVVIGICKKDRFYRNLMLKNMNLEIIYLLTLQKPLGETTRIPLESNEDFDLLLTGIERLTQRTKGLYDISRLITWMNIFTPELPYQPNSIILFGKIKETIRSIITKNNFYKAHEKEDDENWIRVLNKWNVLGGNVSLEYSNQLEFSHRNFNLYDYWRLVFLIESINQGFIDQALPKNELEDFLKKLSNIVKGLRLGLNISSHDLKPKTKERWYPQFREVDDLISIMKKSNKGNRIIENQVLADWQPVKRYSDFAKNRHAGMVKSGYWNVYKRIRNFQALTD